MRNIKTWTNKEVAQLKTVFKQCNEDVNKAVRILSVELERTENCVRLKLYRIIKEKQISKTEDNKRPFRFWTNAEIQAVITSIEKFKSVRKAVKWLATKIDRSEGNIYNKAKELSKKGLLILPVKAVKTSGYVKKTAKIDVKPVMLPKGLDFSFNPSRAEMHKDHIKLFF
jgi:predicted Ser/Thr protein kinase